MIKSTKKGQKSTSDGRKLTARSPENVEAVRDYVEQSPKKSLQRCSQELGLSRSSVHRILKNDLQLYPYRIQINQTLTQNGMPKPVKMCQWFESRIEENPDFLQNVRFSDEAHFSPSDHLNNRNCVFWESEAPDEVLQRSLHSVKCTAWVTISEHGIIGLFWFNDIRETMMINKEHYIVVLNKFWRTPCAHRGVHREEQWFQQDRATPHTANVTMEWLDQPFAGRRVSRHRIPEWSLHSPDFFLNDIFLVGIKNT